MGEVVDNNGGRRAAKIEMKMCLIGGMDEDIAPLALNAIRRQKALNERRRLKGIGALKEETRLDCESER